MSFFFNRILPANKNSGEFIFQVPFDKINRHNPLTPLCLPTFGRMSVDVFEQEVWNQRYFELCYEGTLWFDMLRTRKVRNDITKAYDDFVGHRNVFDATFGEEQLRFPIPLREMDVNAELRQKPRF